MNPRRAAHAKHGAWTTGDPLQGAPRAALEFSNFGLSQSNPLAQEAVLPCSALVFPPPSPGLAFRWQNDRITMMYIHFNSTMMTWMDLMN